MSSIDTDQSAPSQDDVGEVDIVLDEDEILPSSGGRPERGFRP